MHRTTRTRRLPLFAGIAAGALLAVAAPLAASAHVEVSPDSASAGETTRLSFGFHHGCDGSPTTALVIDIPDGVGNAMPVYEGGWTITRTVGDNGVPTQVTFTADTPIESDTSASVSMDVLFDSDTADTTVAFPVAQTCVAGETEWTEIPAAGQGEDSVEHPAPAVAVGAAVAATDDDAQATDAATPVSGETAAAAAPGSSDAVARWLGAGGLVAGLAALVVVLARGRRTRTGR